jgi:hypothetical protein
MKLYPLPAKAASPLLVVPALSAVFSRHIQLRRSTMRRLTAAAALSVLCLSNLPIISTCEAQRKATNEHAVRNRPNVRMAVQAPTPAAVPSPSPQEVRTEDSVAAGQKIKLYYLREASKISTVLNAVAKQESSQLKGLVITNATEDEMILYGPKAQREHAYQIIATLDLPRPGINMEMWGIQISSRKPDEMARVMPEVRQEINRTQEAVRETYIQLQRLARNEIRTDDLDVDFQRVLVTSLGYESALDAGRPLSIADILLRMIAARESGIATARIANGLDAWLRSSNYRDYVSELNTDSSPQRKAPFERFFRARGLRYSQAGWADGTGEVQENAEQGRRALLDFALHYGQLVHQPQSFSAYYLQQSAEILNSRLQAATDALSLDMQDLFVAPTLARIRRRVRRFKDVEYAQVGKVSVASLSGVSTAVTSYSVNAFDVTPPLRLSELLDRADKLAKSTGTFVPKPADNVVGAMPLSQVIGLIGAFGEERAVWRELKSGVSLTILPNVLRNMTSAELKVDLKTGDPQAGTREAGVKPLSRVSQHDVSTSIYVNALDFFDLSAFASQSTLNGGRGYVPIIGPIWQGVFGAIPVFGGLFSWKRPPQNVYSESLVLTNSFISPTAMGIALLYPTQLSNKSDENPDTRFRKQQQDVRQYKERLRSR